nr:hypothetical protein [Tanacetum cinerariifolium]
LLDLKIKLLNRIQSNKSNETHTIPQQLYESLYESITLDQDALDSQAAQSSFHKRSHDNQDPPNNHEGENKKKQRKDDKLTIADLDGAGLERLKVEYNNDVELEYHVNQLKAAILSEDQ